MRLFSLFFCAWVCIAQVRIPGPGGSAAAGGSTPTFLQTKAHNDDTTGTTEAITLDSNATSGGVLAVFYSDNDSTCNGNRVSIADTLGNTWSPIPSGQFVTNLAIRNGGSGYSGACTCTSTGGCVTDPTCTCTITAGAITSVNISSKGATCTGVPTIGVTGAGGGSGAVIVVGDMCAPAQFSGSHGWWTHESSSGADTITITTTVTQPYRYAGVQEWSNVTQPDATSPGVYKFNNSATTSVTTAAFSTASSTVATVCGAYAAAAITFSAGSIGGNTATIPTGAGSSTAGTQTSEYYISSSALSGATASITAGSSYLNMFCTNLVP